MTDIQKVRLLIADTLSVQFTDAQIQAFLDMEGSVNAAAAAAIEAWAAGAISTVDSEKIGDYAHSKKSITNALDLAKRLRDAEASSPVQDWAEFNFTDIDDTEDL